MLTAERRRVTADHPPILFFTTAAQSSKCPPAAPWSPTTFWLPTFHLFRFAILLQPTCAMPSPSTPNTLLLILQFPLPQSPIPSHPASPFFNSPTPVPPPPFLWSRFLLCLRQPDPHPSRTKYRSQVQAQVVESNLTHLAPFPSSLPSVFIPVPCCPICKCAPCPSHLLAYMFRDSCRRSAPSRQACRP